MPIPMIFGTSVMGFSAFMSALPIIGAIILILIFGISGFMGYFIPLVALSVLFVYLTKKVSVGIFISCVIVGLMLWYGIPPFILW